MKESRERGARQQRGPGAQQPGSDICSPAREHRGSRGEETSQQPLGGTFENRDLQILKNSQNRTIHNGLF